MEQPSKAATMFSSVMDIFKPKAAPPANPTIPDKDTIQNVDGTGPKAIPAAGKDDASPLDGYAKLWEHAETDAKALVLVPPMEADPAKLLAAAKTVDFSKAINPEVLAAAAKGDPEALSRLINESSQAGYAQAAMATTKILEAALNKQAQMFETKIMPEVLRRHDAGNATRTANPIFDNPAVKPMLKDLEKQLAIKYQGASAEEISNHAKTVLTGMAEDIIKHSGRTIADAPSAEVTRTLGRTEMNWEEHFLGKPAGS